MDKQKNTAARVQIEQQKDNQVNNKIPHSLLECKPIPDKFAVLTKKPRIMNGLSTKLLVIDRDNFRLALNGLYHASGAFFKLDRTNYQAAKHFLCSGVVA